MKRRESKLISKLQQQPKKYKHLNVKKIIIKIKLSKTHIQNYLYHIEISLLRKLKVYSNSSHQKCIYCGTLDMFWECLDEGHELLVFV